MQVLLARQQELLAMQEELLARQEQLFAALIREIRSIREDIKDLIASLSIERPVDTVPRIQGTIPLTDSDMLNNMLQTIALRARHFCPHYRLSVISPAHTITIFDFIMPEGFYCTSRTPITFESNYYDPSIVINVYVDGTGPENLVTPSGMQMYPEGTIVTVNFGNQWLKKRFVRMEFVNNSAVDAQITFEISASLLHHTVYESWYKPILESTRARLNDLAKAMGGQAI